MMNIDFERLLNNPKLMEETKTKKEKFYNVEDTIIFRQLRDKSSLGLMLDVDDQSTVVEATGRCLFLLFIV